MYFIEFIFRLAAILLLASLWFFIYVCVPMFVLVGILSLGVSAYKYDHALCDQPMKIDKYIKTDLFCQ